MTDTAFVRSKTVLHDISRIDARDDRPTPKAAFLTEDALAVLRFAADALEAGLAAALVTLVRIDGGSARPLGAQMAVREDGLYCGVISGGCVEAAAAHEALNVIHTDRDRDIVYGQGSPWIDIVLPCGGGIVLNIHKLRSAHPLLAVLSATAQRQPAGLRYHAKSQTLCHLSGATQTGWTENVFETGYRPTTRVIVFGRNAAIDTTARLAQAAGYEVHTHDGTRLCGTGALIDEDSAVVLLYHDLERELPVLEAALNAAPFYIGALGSDRTHQRRTALLTQRGLSPDDIARIKAPIGIFPKARDAVSLAFSVMADIALARGQQASS